MDGNFLGSLWDDAKGVFRDLIDFEKFKFERELALDRLQFEAAINRQQAPLNPSTGVPSFASGASSNITPFLIAGAVVLGAVLLIKS